jgi:hypothetical protein
MRIWYGLLTPGAVRRGSTMDAFGACRNPRQTDTPYRMFIMAHYVPIYEVSGWTREAHGDAAVFFDGITRDSDTQLGPDGVMEQNDCYNAVRPHRSVQVNYSATNYRGLW